MISNVTSCKHKSWRDNLTNLPSLSFKQANIGFGHNGAGKSSLALGVVEEYRKTDKNKESVRLFGSKYVENTLMLEDKSGIRGVISNFGEKDVDLEKKILANNTKIQEISDDIAKEAKARATLVQATESLMKDIVTRRKDKNKKINNKPADKSVHEKAQLWIDDYDKAYKDFPDEDYNKLTGAVDFTVESDQINSLVIPGLPSQAEDIDDEVAAVFAKSYPEVNVPQSEVVKWLETGVHIHKGKALCEFCGNKLDVTAIKTKIEIYLNDERHKASALVEEYQKTLVDIVSVAKQVIENKGIYVTILKLNEADFEAVEKAASTITDFAENDVNAKLKSMSSIKALPANIPDSIGAISAFIDSIEEAKKTRARDVTDKINRLETLVKVAIGFEIQNTQTITDNLDAITKHNDQIKSLELARGSLSQKNVELSQQKSDLADFAIYLNTVLSDLNLNFKLELNQDCYILKHADGSALKVGDISDGERHLLSLIYFYYEMLSDSQGSIKDTIKLIVIDDPISSLDDNNKFYITELVKTILEQSSAQVFVFTHSWDDFCNLAYGQGSKETTALFEISKSNGVSSIELINGERLIKPYRLLYKEVYAFSQKNTADITDEEVLHIPNVMRRVLEDYIKFAVDVDFATAHKSGAIANALFGKELAELSNTQKQRMNILLSICNILSHKANQPKNKTEVYQSARFLMATIENYNKYHHHKMRS